LAVAVFATHVRPRPTTSEEGEIRALLSQWIDAYQNLDATRQAALEVQMYKWSIASATCT